jgi:hypothetical protein
MEVGGGASMSFLGVEIEFGRVNIIGKSSMTCAWRERVGR